MKIHLTLGINQSSKFIHWQDLALLTFSDTKIWVALTYNIQLTCLILYYILARGTMLPQSISLLIHDWIYSVTIIYFISNRNGVLKFMIISTVRGYLNQISLENLLKIAWCMVLIFKAHSNLYC